MVGVRFSHPLLAKRVVNTKVFVTLFCVNNIKERSRKFGQRSLELYLVHVAVRKLMKNEGMNTCHPRNELIMVVTAIVLTCLLHVIVQAIQKKILHSK